MITIKLKISEDQIIQAGEDIAYAMGKTNDPESKDVLQPFTLELLHEILQEVMEKSVRMVKRGTQFSELCEHINDCMAADQGGLKPSSDPGFFVSTFAEEGKNEG